MTRQTFLETSRLDLCPPEEDDVEFLHEGVNHPAIRKYNVAFRKPVSETRYREENWPPDSEKIELLAVPKSGEFGGEPVGSLQLYPFDHGNGDANFGLWFHPTAWGNGYALEAGAHVIDYGFSELRLHRVSAGVMAGNDASKTLIERLGFTHEGVSRDAWFADGEYRDRIRYGLLRSEWEGPDAVL